jgi:hypothetical protein
MTEQVKKSIGALAVALAAAGLLAATVAARTAAVPQNTAAPRISGQTREGSTLTAGNGTWSNAPTSYAYQWQRCTSGGTGCANIAGATSKAYTLAAADVDHRMRVLVTATNADGSTSAPSSPSGIVSASGAPTNTVPPNVSGTPVVGNELTATNGTWTGGATSFSLQWQRCPATTLVCVNIAGATGHTYGVRAADVGQRLRVRVTARNSSSSASADSDPTAVVTATPTTTVVTTVAGNKAPTLTFQSLKVRSNRVYVRFRVCDDSFGRVTVIARDSKAHKLSYTRRFGVSPTPCGTYSRNWLLISRFRGHGRFAVSLRAVDRSGRTSVLRSRSILR